MLQGEPSPPKRTRLARAVLIAFAALLLIIGVAAGFAWNAARQAAADAIDAMIAAEQKHGRLWSCPERQFSGFPFAIAVSCKEPRYAGPVSGKPMNVQVQAFRAAVYLWHPQEVAIEVEGPFALRSKDASTDLAASWSALRLVVSAVPSDVAEIAFNGRDLALHGATEGHGAALSLDAQHFDGVIGKAASGQPRAVDFRLNGQHVTNPLLALVVGSAQSVDIKAQGTLTEADIDPSALPAVSLEQWRSKGGHVDFADLAFIQGETHISARGMLTLDAAHRVQGKLDAQAQNIEPILRRYGIDPGLVSAGMLLSNLLGGASNTPPGAPAALHLPVRLQDGNIIIGPVQTSVHLPALY